MFRIAIALILTAVSAGVSALVPPNDTGTNMFSSEEKCLEALQVTGSYIVYTPKDTRTHYADNPVDGVSKIKTPLSATACVYMWTINKWQWVVQEKGTAMRANKKPDETLVIYARDDCGNRIRKVSYPPAPPKPAPPEIKKPDEPVAEKKELPTEKIVEKKFVTYVAITTMTSGGETIVYQQPYYSSGIYAGGCYGCGYGYSSYGYYGGSGSPSLYGGNLGGIQSGWSGVTTTSNFVPQIVPMSGGPSGSWTGETSTSTFVPQVVNMTGGPSGSWTGVASTGNFTPQIVQMSGGPTGSWTGVYSTGGGLSVNTRPVYNTGGSLGVNTSPPLYTGSLGVNTGGNLGVNTGGNLGVNTGSVNGLGVRTR